MDSLPVLKNIFHILCNAVARFIEREREKQSFNFVSERSFMDILSIYQ